MARKPKKPADGESTSRRKEPAQRKKPAKREQPVAPKKATKAPQPPVATSASLDADDVRQLLAVGEGFRLEDVDAHATPGFAGGKAEGKQALADGAAELSELQERLFAEGRTGGRRSLLLVVQGMDTSGKGGIMRHVMGAVDPQGVDLASFKAPTAQERDEPFLARIRRALPRPGQVGVFDRSHYEDVLVVRVHDLVPPGVWKRRYATINRFEQGLVDAGTTVVKVMLHVSREEQKDRLLKRLDRPDKHWKYSPGDVDERAHWDDYQQAYQEALTRCSTDAAPWFVVPADRKWYARWAVHQLLVSHLRELDPQWPVADFDVEAERSRLLES